MSARHGRRLALLRWGLHGLLASVATVAFSGCAAGTDAPVAAASIAPEGQVRCPNMQLAIPQGWSLERSGGTHWRPKPPQASSFDARIVCLVDAYPNIDMNALAREGARHLGWDDKILPSSGLRVTNVMLNTGPISGMGSFNIFCRQYALADDRFDLCVIADPYPRREQRGDSYIVQRWSEADPVALAQRAELAESVTTSFHIHPTPESRDDQHP